MLVHFGARSHTVYGEVKDFLGSYDVDNLVDVVKNVGVHVVLSERNGNAAIFRMSTGVNDTVHIKVEIVDNGVITVVL